MPCVWDPRRSRGGTGGGADALLYTVQDPRRSSGGGAGADALPSFQWEEQMPVREILTGAD